MVDHQWRQLKDSSESGLAATPVGESLPQVGEKWEGSTGILTGGNFGRWGHGIRRGGGDAHRQEALSVEGDARATRR
jgi:hypothetical protein